ncbi:MAG: hypothetical protein HY791_15925 [Deltaproteobacteria bacterium]|nr:hypothetical protein [Deltaproteobacteria bacterium]
MPDANDLSELLHVPDSLRSRRSVDSRNPRSDHRNASPWLDEYMWGHRLFDSQSPWLIFLEFLSVAEGLSDDARLLTNDAPYPLTFKPAQRMYLRNILFSSDEAMRNATEEPEARGWDTFISQMEENALGIPVPVSFAYLRTHFSSFADFSQVLRLLRASTVERESNKRWSSRFLFPFGPHSVYEDLNVKPNKGAPSREYINFGRTGELMYLMIARSGLRERLEPIVGQMVRPGLRWDRLVSFLEPPGGDPRRETRGLSYLPYSNHPIFDALAQDWVSISELKLPTYDKYPHLVTLGSLHLVRYFLTIAAAWDDQGDGIGNPSIVCEIIAPRKTLVRELSLQSFGFNDGLSTAAIERTVSKIEQTAAWNNAAVNGYGECLRLLIDALNWDAGTYSASNQPADLLNGLKTEARRRHRQYLAQFHRSVGRAIGLVSRRATNRFRYAPTDELMKTLLLAAVPHRMEFGEFLRELHVRYGLVVGPREAAVALDREDFDQKAFQANAVRLEERLASLGLLRRLSDACAYVINPYAADVGR